MARNKHPEETERRILQVSRRLFLEKGYEHTTIQDIVDALGNLTKGAVYHHFSCKEDILNALGDQMFYEDNPFEEVCRHTELSGLEKMRRVIFLTRQNAQRVELTRHSIPLLQNPQVLAQTMENDRKTLVPLWRKLLEEGNRDGSLHTEYVNELAEVLPMLFSLWLGCGLVDGEQRMMCRVRFLAEMLDKAGVPLFDEASMETMRQYIAELTRQKPE